MQISSENQNRTTRNEEVNQPNSNKLRGYEPMLKTILSPETWQRNRTKEADSYKYRMTELLTSDRWGGLWIHFQVLLLLLAAAAEKLHDLQP